MAEVYRPEADRKPAAYLLDAGYQLVYMVVMGMILASWA